MSWKPPSPQHMAPGKAGKEEADKRAPSSPFLAQASDGVFRSSQKYQTMQESTDIMTFPMIKL